MFKSPSIYINNNQLLSNYKAQVKKPEPISSAIKTSTKTVHPTDDHSLPAQVRHQLYSHKARHITDNIYQFTLSKNKPYMAMYQLTEQLAPLKLKEHAIQYISQTHGEIIVNLTIPNKLKTH